MAGKRETVVLYACSKCGQKVAGGFHLIGKGRLLCSKCEHDLRRFIEKTETTAVVR